MIGSEVKRIREKLGLSREEFAEVFGLSGYRTVMNIETDFRRPSQLTIILLRALDSLSTTKAHSILELLKRHSDV
jgi:DNA-binding transcriptional regulator YiaG